MKTFSARYKITHKIKVACQSIEIVLVDHVIICEQNSYFSFADEGVL
ncbi:MAG: hypothetical protein IPK03_03485 [Bacteroidetes bacterium]|nr:hypothetical protein [Bacteroidota bacterium]